MTVELLSMAMYRPSTELQAKCNVAYHGRQALEPMTTILAAPLSNRPRFARSLPISASERTVRASQRPCSPTKAALSGGAT
jgi:hypothetical protein